MNGLRPLVLDEEGLVAAIDHDYRKRGPHGLLGMTERVQLYGGNLVIESALGDGTCIKVDLPLLVG